MQALLLTVKSNPYPNLETLGLILPPPCVDHGVMSELGKGKGKGKGNMNEI